MSQETVHLVNSLEITKKVVDRIQDLDQYVMIAKPFKMPSLFLIYSRIFFSLDVTNRTPSVCCHTTYIFFSLKDKF